MSSSVYANNKTRNIVVLGEGFAQGLDDTTLFAEKCVQLILARIMQNFA